ncbi:MAG: DUF397 domain-containing protein [Micromonosporaceae bacterium]|nr:DUF397 domain-containing protein [Micromonosporaceae bacterium]
MIDLSGAQWRKSTRSGPNTDNCVEVANLGDRIAVRDSKDPTGPVLVFTPAEWDARSSPAPRTASSTAETWRGARARGGRSSGRHPGPRLPQLLPWRRQG